MSISNLEENHTLIDHFLYVLVERIGWEGGIGVMEGFWILFAILICLWMVPPENTTRR